MIVGIIGTSQTGELKWDASNVDIAYADENQIEITFDTAWSPPEPICNRLREMFDDIHVSWFYDDGNGVRRVSIGQFVNCPLGVA